MSNAIKRRKPKEGDVLFRVDSLIGGQGCEVVVESVGRKYFFVAIEGTSDGKSRHLIENWRHVRTNGGSPTYTLYGSKEEREAKVEHDHLAQTIDREANLHRLRNLDHRTLQRIGHLLGLEDCPDPDANPREDGKPVYAIVEGLKATDLPPTVDAVRVHHPHDHRDYVELRWSRDRGQWELHSCPGTLQIGRRVIPAPQSRPQGVEP